MPPRPRVRAIPRRWLLAGAAAYASAELGSGLLLGRFFDWGRAEALLFFAFRPWLLVAAALLVRRFDSGSRAACYALALLTAGLSESLLLVAMGGAPWPEMLRGWAAGGALVLGADLLFQLGRRSGHRAGTPVAALLAALMLLVPGALRPYEALALGPTASRPVAARPSLLLMTGLPILWGETGPFDPASRPAAAYRALQHEFAVRPLDFLDGNSLSPSGLMLLAQPRALAPTELVALDHWARQGGRILILADPDLVRPTALPAGDLRRPPPVSLLSPLLAHWGLRLEPAPERRLALEMLRDGRHLRRLAMAAPGRFLASGGQCRTGPRDFLALCRIGRGRALLVADSDLLHDRLWAAPGPRGAERHARLADNPLIVAGWLDRLGGRHRERAAPPVRWQSPGAARAEALLLALLPILAASVGAIGLARFRRR
ncbi:MAG TPA: hypothetical protein VN231_06840 [Allosphingosinicella sp.]|nr:hypothetical protein [Allosphingosinicella sp.]